MLGPRCCAQAFSSCGLPLMSRVQASLKCVAANKCCVWERALIHSDCSSMVIVRERQSGEPSSYGPQFFDIIQEAVGN